MATDWSKITPVYENGEQPKKQKTDWSKITPAEDAGFLRGAADTGLSIARGAATGTKMVADAFGADNVVSRGAGRIADGLGNLKSDQSKWKTQAGVQRMEAAEASGSKLNEFVAGAKNFLDQPLDMAAEGIGSSAPTLAAVALSRGKVNPFATGAGAGAVQGAGSVKGEIYDEVKQRHIAANLPEADAARRAQEAQSYGGENMDSIVGGSLLGAVASTSGAEGAVSRIIGNTTKSGLKPIAASIAAEGATEFAQGGQERLASNIAAQREGFDAPTWQGVVGQGTMEGLAGAGSGAVFGVGEAMAGGRPPVEFDPNAGAISKALAQHPDTVPASQPIIPPPGLEPAQPIDPITAQANYAKVIAQSDPMALDKAQGIASAMNQSAQGAESYTVAPHGEAGFTVVPTAWMTDEQLTSFAAIQGDGGRLPAPLEDSNPVIRVDADGNAVMETPEQVAEVEAMKQRYIDMGVSTPRGVNPNEGPHANPAIPATEQNGNAGTNKSEDIAGEKIDRKWTEFDQASGTLGIDRAQMPQIKAEHRGAMVNFLNARGITSEQATVLPTDLKATQREFSPGKVEKAKGFTGNDRSILVSSDGHVLDGHHQWLAKRESGQPVKVIRLNAPIRELLTAVSEFPSAQTAAGATAQNGATNGTTDADLAALADTGGEVRSDNGAQGVPAALVLPDGRGVGDAADGTGAGGRTDIPAGHADRNDTVIARVGTTPNSAEPVTVRGGVVHIGEAATDITVPEGATSAQVADALRANNAVTGDQRIYEGAKGMRQVRAPAKPRHPERRADNARRQLVSEMDAETLRRELLTDAITGLGNRRAYEESTKLPAQVSIDADSLKWVNDNLGHASGDKLLKAIGQALREETRSAYHVSGDEFIVQAETEAEAQAIMDRAVARMADARIDATNIDGQDIVLTGVGVSYGIAGDLHEAEKRLGQHKAEREIQGQRAARGETPPNAVVGSGRGEDQPGDAAGEAEVSQPAKTDYEAEAEAQQPKKNAIAEAAAATRARRAEVLAILGDGWKASSGVEGSRDIYKKRVGPLEVSVMPQTTTDGKFNIGSYRHSGERKGPGGSSFAQTIEEAAEKANALFVSKADDKPEAPKADPKAAAKAAKSANAAKSKAERDLHVLVATDADTLALAGTLELDAFIDGANAKLVEQITAIAGEYDGAEADAILELVQDGKPVLPRKFYESAYKDAKKAWAEQQKNAARDPEAYKEVLRWGYSVKNLTDGTPEATEYKAGFDHALKGKSKSTLPQGVRYQFGYEDARAWIKTEDGKAWFEGKPRQGKEKSTGESLKRTWDRARKGVDAVNATEKKDWEQILKSTARAEFFPIMLSDDATPGAKDWLAGFRDKIATFSEYYTRVMVAGKLKNTRYGLKASDVFTGRYTSYKGRIAERYGDEASGQSVRVTDEQRLELTKEVAREYQQQISDLAQKFDGLKNLSEIQKVIEDTYGQPGEYKLGTLGVDAALYYDNSSDIEGRLPKKPDAWDYKYSTWKALVAGENIERETNERKDTLLRPRLDRIVREMPDTRKGRSVTADEFKKTFNFGDVTIGQYVTAQEAEDHLNYAYDALQSLALMLGAKPAQLSFGGKLQFSIGALGHGKYAAHFQPAHPKENGATVPVINITKTKGDGAVLHEYFHAIDFMTTDPKLKAAILDVKKMLVGQPKDPDEARKVAEDFLSGFRYFKGLGRGSKPIDHARYGLRHYYSAGNKGSVQTTQFFRNAQALDKGSKDPYWSNQYEPWARAAESWGLDRLLDSKQRDDYLQSDWAADGKVTSKTHRGTPYPQGEERKVLNGIMDQFVKAIEWTDAGPVLREGHAWHTEMPYAAMMAKYQKAVDQIVNNLEQVEADMKARKANESSEKAAEKERLEAEAMFGKQEEAPEIEPPTASSEPEGDAPMSEDELAAIFDEESAATREATQEEPEAEAPGAKLDDMAWTKEDAKVLLTLVNAGRIVLVADSSLGLPTIHDIKGADHKGFGVFHVNTPEYEGNFTAGGAMDRTPSGKGYTTFSLTRGDAPFWNKEDVAAKLRVLAGEPGKSAIEHGKVSKAKRDGKDLPDLTAEQDKTASALAGEFAKHGVKGIENTLDGLVKLFGGGSGKLQSFPSGFDKDTYEQAKPLFRAAAEEFRKAGMSFKDFVRVFFRTLIQQFGDGVKPYAIQFAQDYQDGYEQTETDKPASDEPVMTGQDPSAKLSDWVLGKLKADEDISWQDLFAQADADFGGSQANGVYTPKDAYDAVELAINRYMLDAGGEFDPATDQHSASVRIKTAANLLNLIPTQTKRTAEMDEFQQFSTPPHFSYLANWVANLNATDTYLEPSAGVGGLAVYGKIAGVKRVIVNEFSARRVALLRNLPFDGYFTENAEQLNNVMPDDVKPTVIVMNPPFSATAGRAQGSRDTMNGAQHIEQALKFLQPGGRLVAIVGEGMGADKPAFVGWWSKIKKEYNVRANIGIDGSSYAKYGTTFDNQILVIDKSGATTGEVITGKVDHPADALQLLEAVRNDRPEATQSNGDVAGRAGSDADAQSGGRVQDTGAAGPAVDPAMGGRGRPGTDGQSGADNGGTADAVGDGKTQGGRKNSSKPGKPGNGNAANADGGKDAAGDRAGRTGAGGTSRSDVTLETASNAESGEVTNSVFESYTPKKVRIPGAVPHNTPLVESSAMAAVQPPDPTHTPNLPKEIIKGGLLSDAQLETVVYAGQAHDQMLRDGETRRGFFLGDGTGVGKGRQISAIIMDNMRQGRTKAVWLSKKKELIEDAIRDFGDLGGDTKLIFPLAKVKHGTVIEAKQGILFAGYPAMRSQSRASQQKQKAAGGKKQKDDAGISFDRVRQIVEWLGADYDGVIAFDESHEMGNAVAVKGKRGMTTVSDTALAGLELQKALPKARVVYVSATGATEVRNLAYAERLGLWGEGTPFESVNAFIGSMSKSVSAMELVAQNLKQMGLYMARSLSYDGIAYDKLEHQLSPYQRDTYDLLAESWQTVLNNINEALKATGVMGEKEDGGSKASGRESGKIKSGVMSAFWGSHQRFFNQIITASQMPSILEQVEQDLKDGKSVVLQLTNTNEADQNRALAKAAGQKADEDADEDSIEELDLTPREQLITLLEKAFPVQQFEQYTDPENPDIKRIRPVLDAQGKPVINKEMLAKRDELIQNIRNIRIPDSPLQMLIDQFGADKVAEITGRGQRIVKDENGKMKVEKRGNPAVQADAQAFKDGKKRILVFSQAGGTGFSFHSDKRYKNRQQRAHYIVQAGWSADKAVQGFGRTHRTNQENAPIYRLVMTDIPAHKRFISSIARRLEQLGALTAGQRDTAGGSLFSSSDNLESPYATKAVRQFFEGAVSKTGSTDGFPDDLITQMGLADIVDEKTGGLNETKIPATTQFLNRLLSLRLDTQEVVFDRFMSLLEQQIEMAKRLGAFDDGLQTIKHVGAEVVQEKEVYRDPSTNADVRYIEIKYKTPNTFYGFAAANGTLKANKRPAGWFKNKHSGRVAGVWETSQTSTNKQGVVEKMYGIWRTSGTSYEAASKYKPDGFERIKDDEAQALWEAESAQRPEHKEHTVHMVVGGILPLWDRFNDDRVSVSRIGVDDGRRFLGRQIFESDLADTLNKLNVESSAAKMTGSEIIASAMSGNAVNLSNGWSLKKVRVSNDDRIEVLTNGKFMSYAQIRQLGDIGAITERISWVDRYFVPTDKAKGGAVVDSLLQKFGANAVSVGGQDAVADDDTAFSRTETNGLTDAEAIKRVVRVQGVVNGIKANWKNAPEIIVVANMQDAKVPQRVRDMDAEMKSGGASGEPRGFISAGKVYIVAGQHKSVEDVVTTVAHETLGHAGLRGLYGDALKPILRQIVNMRRAEVNAKVKEYGFDPSSERDLLRAAEEVLANMAQTRPEMGFVKRAIAAIRQWMRDNGINLKLSDGDIIANWILPARAFIESGRGPGGGSRATSFLRGKPSDPVTLDHRDWKRPKGDTFAGYATRAEYEAKLAADEEQAKRISESYRTGRDMTARYGIRTAQETQRAEGIDSSSKDSTRSDDTAFSRTVEIRAAVSERAADLLTSQKTFNNWWHKTVGTQYHKAHVDADYRKAFNAVQSYLSGMAMFANSSADLADRLIPQLNSIRDLWNAKQPSQADIKAISAPIFAGTLEDEKVYGGDELRGRFKLNQDQIDLYVQFRASVDKSLDDLGKTDILRYAGKDAEHLRDEVMAASTASRAAIKVAAHLNDIGKADDAKVVMDKGMRVADLKAKGYAPLTRFGKYTVHVTEGDEQLYFSLFESEAEANAMARQMRQDNPGATVTQGVLSAESYKLFNGISPDTLELFAGALGVENNALVQEYIKLAKSNRSAMKRMIKRKGIAGFSEDVPRILASFITSNARQSASNVYGGQMDKAAEAIPREKGDVKDEAIKMIDFARNPTEDAAKLRGMLFVQYIGGSVASAMVNLTQPITMSYPYLHQFSKTAGRELARAMKLATVGGELDADMKQALKRAEMDGVVSPQEIHQLQAEAVKKGAGVGSLARMFGVKGGTANKLDDLSKRGLFAWGSLFSLAEQFNRRSTFIAAYNIARQNKESDPFAFAEKAVVETQGIYNRGNRPDWARGAPGALIFTFKQYSISYMEFLVRLPPKEKAIALAILVLAAGLQGIPFADDLDDLIDTLAQQMGYAWNTKAEKEKFAASILGQTGAAFALHGTSALPGFPLDFSARLGMSNLLPGTGILLKNKTDKMGEVLDVFGVAGGVVKDALRGEVLPIAVRNVLKAADMANTGMYRDWSGKKVVDTDGLDAATKLIGFHPAKVAGEGRAARMDMQDVQLVRNIEAEIAGDMAQGIFTGDKKAVAKAREALADWNAKNPDKPIVITNQQIMARVKKMAQTRRERLIASAPKELRGGLVE